MSDVQQMPIRLPRATIRALKLYAADKDTKLQTIGVEALKMWAEKHGVDLKLPVKPDNSEGGPLTGINESAGSTYPIRA